MYHLTDELLHIKELLRAHPVGMSITEIARELHKNKHSIGRYLDILHASGHVDLRTYGMAKVYTLSSRVPVSALLNYTTDLVLLLDRDNRVMQVNDPFLDLLQLPREQVMMQSLSHLPVADTAVSEFIQSACEPEQAHKSTPITLASEPKRFFDRRIIPTVFDSGDSGTTVILTDITENFTNILTMQENEALFRSISENISDGLVVIEGQKIIYVNNRVVEIIGYSKEEIQGNCINGISDIAMQEEKDRVQDAEESICSGRLIATDLRFWAKHKDGNIRYLYVRITRTMLDDAIMRYYILITDMTEWKHKEEEKSLQYSIIEQLMNNFPHPIFILDEKNRFFSVNNSFEQLFHLQKNEIKEKVIQSVLPKDISESLTSEGNDMNIDIPKSSPTCIPISINGEERKVFIKKDQIRLSAKGDIYTIAVIIECEGTELLSCNDCRI